MFAVVSRRLSPAMAQASVALQTASFTSTRWAAKPPDPRPVPMSKLYDSFLDGTSSSYLEELERKYNEDPSSVDKTWAGFFRHVGAALSSMPLREPRHAFDSSRSCAVPADSGIEPESISEAFHAFQSGKTPSAASPLSAAGLSNQTIQESMRLLLLIRAYQVRIVVRVRRWRERARSAMRCVRMRSTMMAQCGTRPSELAYALFHAHATSIATISSSSTRGHLHGRVQVNGHFAAKLDPLGLSDRELPTVMDPKLYGFSESDMDRECAISRSYVAATQMLHHAS
jgi:2-oxoglutarate dehydrogenase complex dehydrogenase (E1) component-like enzyme